MTEKKKTALIKNQFGLKIKIRKNKKNICNKYQKLQEIYAGDLRNVKK